MSSHLSKITKEEIEKLIILFIPKNKRGFQSKVSSFEIIQCILYKLKTGCQWNRLFHTIEWLQPNYSWQLVYYFYRRWSKLNVFKEMFETILMIQSDKLDTEIINLDGTHSLAKKGGESIAYQHRKKGRTSNLLVVTDGRGIPIGVGENLFVEYTWLLVSRNVPRIIGNSNAKFLLRFMKAQRALNL